MKYMRMGPSVCSLCFPVLFNCEHESLRSTNFDNDSKHCLTLSDISILRELNMRLGFSPFLWLSVPQKAKLCQSSTCPCWVLPDFLGLPRPRQPEYQAWAKVSAFPQATVSSSLTHLKNHSQKQPGGCWGRSWRNTHFFWADYKAWQHSKHWSSEINCWSESFIFVHKFVLVAQSYWLLCDPMD